MALPGRALSPVPILGHWAGSGGGPAASGSGRSTGLEESPLRVLGRWDLGSFQPGGKEMLDNDINDYGLEAISVCES